MKIRKHLKKFSILALVIFLNQLAFPTYVLALTGGPTQPEVHGFEPIGTNQMVDLFSGDFTYNIPLFDIGGYPINMAYHSGVGMEQEASWVGLGWSLTPGAISRSLRGLPDDFKEDEIKFTRKMKPNNTIGLDLAFDPEIAGFELGSKAADMFGEKAKASLSMGVTYNNYTGIDINSSVSVSFSEGMINPSIGYSGNGGLSVGAKPSLAAIARHRDKNSDNGKTNLGKLSSFVSMDGEVSWSSTSGLGMSIEAGRQNLRNKALRATTSQKGNRFQGNIITSEKVYSPGSDISMWNYGVRLNVGLGTEVFIADAQGQADFFFNSQRLGGFGDNGDVSDNVAEWNLKAYGVEYGHESEADNHTNDLLDFNREHEYPLRDESPLLPVSQLTYDMFTVSGQGTGGSFRNYRNDFPLVGKNRVSDAPNAQLNLGLDISSVNLVKVGGSGSVIFSESRNGFWNNGLEAVKSNIGFAEENSADLLFEPNYLKKGGEYGAFDEAYLEALGGEEAMSFELSGQTSATNTLKGSSSTHALSNDVYRQGRDYKRAPRASAILSLTKDEAHNFGFPFRKDGHGINKIVDYEGQNYDQRLEKLPGYASGDYLDRMEDMPGEEHHYGEFQITQDDGYRYVYGLPVYNNKTIEASFAIDKPETDPYAGKGYVGYDPQDATTGNEKGKDNYYSKKEIPAYAHSFMLTAILSPDYVDIKGDGITDDDIGEAVIFNYEKVHDDYGWRNPTTGTANQGRYIEGLNTLDDDDKASYVYGTKEVWILHSIESKNLVAEFYTSNRQDALGVSGEDGATDTGKKQRKLDKIVLSNKILRAMGGVEYDVTPIKTVFFNYDSSYPLCNGISNSANTTGKLTLKELGFTYANSGLGMLSPYKFSYSSTNPNYNPMAIDRWGNYRRLDADKPNHEFPYANQNPTEADEDASAWLLNKIDLPSGGTINVEYEADDYAYVMERRALSMVDIAGVGKTKEFTQGNKMYVDMGAESNFLYFELPDNGYATDQDVKDDFDPGSALYFKCLFQVKGTGSEGSKDQEYVSGYAKIVDMGLCPWTSGPKYGFVEIDDKKDGNMKYQAMSHAAWSMMLSNLTDRVNGMSSANKPDDLLGAGKDFILSNLSKITQILKGQMGKMKTERYAQYIDLSKSIIRLKEPTGFKKGGGTRVKQITMTDNWNDMTDQEESFSEYGSVYTYTTLEDGKVISSGVAAYEPMVGSEENPYKQPMYFDYRPKSVMGLVKVGKKTEEYVLEPYGEMFFPGANVGYSKVRVRSLASKRIQEASIVGSSTGYSESEFYTTRDFPVILDKTVPKLKGNPLKNAALKILTNTTKKDLTMSQGYSVIVNNMHGKPKSTTNYNSIGAEMSSQEFVYKTDATDGSKLDNHVKVLQRDGTVLPSHQVGVEVDFVADAHESINRSYQVRAQPGVDGFSLGIPPFIAIPNLWFKYKSSTNNLRYISNTKVIYKYGIIEKVIARDENSEVHTENLLWDEENGQVLLTRTYNEYGAPLESLSLPAHFNYTGMQGAYKNLGVKIQGTIQVTNGIYGLGLGNVIDHFEPGDELVLRTTNLAGNTIYKKAWVLDMDVSNNEIFLIDRFGEAIATHTFTELRIMRSGKRNQTNAAILQVSSTGDLLSQIDNETIDNAIQVSSAEFSDDWNTYCDRLTTEVCTHTDDLMHILNCLWNKGDNTQSSTPGQGLYTAQVGINLDKECNLDLKSDLRNQAYNLSNIDVNVEYSSSILKYYYSIYSPVDPATVDVIKLQQDCYDLGINNPRLVHHPTVGGPSIGFTIETESEFDPGEDPDDAGPLLPVLDDLMIACVGSGNYTISGPNTRIIKDEEYTVPEKHQAPYFKFMDDELPLCKDEIWIGVGSTETWEDLNGQLDRDDKIPDYPACSLKLTALSPAGQICSKDIVEFTDMSYDPALEQYVLYATMANASTATFLLTNNSCLDLLWCEAQDACGPLEEGININPYIAGIRGNWRPTTNWVYHTSRSSSLIKGAINASSHTNIQSDGNLEDFSLDVFNDPSYAVDVSGSRWVSPTIITEYTPDGSEIENMDVLGRYSSEVFGYDKRVVIAAANNAEHHNIAFDGFEEYTYPFHGTCRKKQHWGMTHYFVPNDYFPPSAPLSDQYHEYGPDDFSERLSENEAHTGHFSLKLDPDNYFFTDDLVKGSCTNITHVNMTPYQLSDCDCIGSFEPDANDKYFVSAWVKETGHTNQPQTYTGTRMKIKVLDDNLNILATYTKTLEPSGPITEGWQRITGEFTIPHLNGLTLRTEVIADATLPGPMYLDDVRIQPFNSQMKTYVYNHDNLRLMAELDENNYATYYEYDAEGKLLRIKKETEAGVMTIQESRYGVSQ